MLLRLHAGGYCAQLAPGSAVYERLDGVLMSLTCRHHETRLSGGGLKVQHGRTAGNLRQQSTTVAAGPLL